MGLKDLRYVTDRENRNTQRETGPSAKQLILPWFYIQCVSYLCYIFALNVAVLSTELKTRKTITCSIIYIY
jgi:hypothetical protein